MDESWSEMATPHAEDFDRWTPSVQDTNTLSILIHLVTPTAIEYVLQYALAWRKLAFCLSLISLFLNECG